MSDPDVDGEAGMSPEYVERCREVGLTGQAGLRVLEHLDGETAIAVLKQWNGPRNTAARQLLSLVKTYSWSGQRLQEILATGLSGSEVYQWRKSTRPPEEWSQWIDLAVTPDVADQYTAAGISTADLQRWDAIGTRLSPEQLPAAIETFGTPSNGKEWAELLDAAGIEGHRGSSSRMDPTAYWRHPRYLERIRKAGLTSKEFSQWLKVGIDYLDMPDTAASLQRHGMSPADYKRWRDAGLSTWGIYTVLGAFGFDEAFDILSGWVPSHHDGFGDRVDELKSLIDAGWGPDQIKAAAGRGLCGHDVYLWHDSKVPVEAWKSWIDNGFEPYRGVELHKRRISPEVGVRWVRSGIDFAECLAAIDLGLTVENAVEIRAQGTDLRSLKLVEGSVVASESTLKKALRRGTLQDLSELIEAGEEVEPGELFYAVEYDGEIGTCRIWITWDGGHEVTWVQRDDRDELSMFSDAPVRGTAAWPNGSDVEVTYDWEGTEGEESLSGAAPTSSSPSLDDGMRDPNQWVILADQLLAVALDAIE